MVACILVKIFILFINIRNCLFWAKLGYLKKCSSIYKTFQICYMDSTSVILIFMQIFKLFLKIWIIYNLILIACYHYYMLSLVSRIILKILNSLIKTKSDIAWVILSLSHLINKLYPLWIILNILSFNLFLIIKCKYNLNIFQFSSWIWIKKHVF